MVINNFQKKIGQGKRYLMAHSLGKRYKKALIKFGLNKIDVIELINLI